MSTTNVPFDIGTIHFVGIGGIGMSGIAEVMHNLHYPVQGSDVSENANVKRLRDLGIKVMIGHAAENLGDAKVVVTSSAIKADNPEVEAARERLLPIVRRAEMLAELMRLKWCVSVAGTHGKTTTTSMVAAVLDAGKFDPTVINGGIINAYGTNARLGGGKWMVVEADESDGTFIKLPSTIAIVTNIDPEHMDFYKSFDDLRRAFLTFVENVPFYGVAVLCIDHPEVQALIGRITDRRIMTYGLSPQAEVRAVNLAYDDGAATFDVEILNRAKGDDPDDRRPASCRCRAGTMSRTRSPPSRSRSIWASTTTRSARGFRGLPGRQAALHQDRRSRTASPSSTITAIIRSRSPMCLRAARQAYSQPGHRRRPAASLHAAQESVRGILHLLQRRRHGDRRRCLSRRRAADRRREQGRAGRRPEGARPPSRHRPARPRPNWPTSSPKRR